jgi:hypothetical protein
MTWWVWERETIAVEEAAQTTSEEGCNRGVLLGLKGAWPPAVGCGHGRTEVEEDSDAAAGEGANTVDAAEGELPRLGGGVHCKGERKCFSLFRAMMPSWE